MEQVGASLPDDRWLEDLPASTTEPVVVDEAVRAAVGALVPGRIEDEFSIEGVVTQADVLSRRFRVNVGRRGIEAPFSPEDKDRVIDALRDSDERRVVVRGRALLERGGTPVRFVSVADIAFVDERAADLHVAWAQLIGLARKTAMPGLPHDLAGSVDDYLYGDRRQPSRGSVRPTRRTSPPCSVPRTNLHDLALLHSQEFEEQASTVLVTTDTVLIELLSLFSGRGQSWREGVAAFVGGVLTSAAVIVEPQSRDRVRAALDLYAGRLDKEWSGVDCLSMVVMSERGINDVLTHDHHFEQAGFALLL